MALTIKKEWLDLVLAGTKTWEIRGKSTERRGFIHFAESGSGQLRGRAQLVGCRQLNRRKFMKYQHKHQVPNAEMVTYKNIWAWILEDAEPYEMPFDYSHTQGAVIFVKVRKPMGPGNRGTANASTKKRKAAAAAGKRQSRGLTATFLPPSQVLRIVRIAPCQGISIAVRKKLLMKRRTSQLTSQLRT